MKRIFTLLTLITLIVMPGEAKILSFGITGGINVTKPNGDKWKADNESGWYAGAKIKYTTPIAGLGFDLALTYSMEKISITDEATNLEADDKINYLSVPLNLRYDLSLPAIGSLVTPYIAVGPQLNYAFNDFKSDWENDNFSTKKMMWRLNLGAGVILFRHLEASYRYGIPLGNTIEWDDASKKNLESGCHQIGVTYYF